MQHSNAVFERLIELRKEQRTILKKSPEIQRMELYQYKLSNIESNIALLKWVLRIK